MEFRRLGNSDLEISEIGLGGNNFGWWLDADASASVIHRALEEGINYIDTADMYDNGHSEEFIGRALKGRRHDAIIATKFGAKIEEGSDNKKASRHHVMRAIEASLRRLQTDYVDIYIQHSPDPKTPIRETMETLTDLVKEGKVRYLGLSNCSAADLNETISVSEEANIEPLRVIQTRYNMLQRESELELVPICQRSGISVIPWGPLAGGFLAGRFLNTPKRLEEGGAFHKIQMYLSVFTAENFDRLNQLAAFAAKQDHSITDLALAWLLTKPYLCTVNAGATNPEQVSANSAASSWKLTASEIEEVSTILA